MSEFFIRHPLTAIAASILVVLGGVIAGISLPIAQYPQITLPTVRVTATYLGADAQATEQSVAQPLEQMINGLDGMLYLSSTSSGSGQYSANVTSRLGINPDMAAVQVQNRVAQANGDLPSEVLNVGITTQKSTPDNLMYLSFNSPNGTFDRQFINSYVGRYIVDPLKRVKGVGNVQPFGSVYAMRIWLKPDRLSQLGLTPTDVANAVQEQNRQAPAGSIGQQPAPPTQQFQYGVKVKGRLTDPAEFADIILRANTDGSIIRIKDVASVELGGQDYSVAANENGKPVAVVAISLTPDASAVETAGLVRAEMATLAASFPRDLRYSVITDNTVFIKASLQEVARTFVEALALVMLVVFMFLQNWRSTFIPMVAVPVSLIGTLVVFLMLGFTLNTLTLFAMVLAIGIVVDDAIVVVEAAEHQMTANGLTPADAAIAAMRQVASPVVAVAAVLSAVFVPCAFLSGISGAMYRQFALTVATSTIISAIVALTLTPALCATMLRPPRTNAASGLVGRFFARFNTWFAALVEHYTSGVRAMLRRIALGISMLAALSVFGFAMMARLPSEFIPSEDQGFFIGTIQLPEAASLNRTLALSERFANKLRKMDGVDRVLTISGFDILNNSFKPNAALFLVPLKPWAQRGRRLDVGTLIRQTFALTRSELGARIVPLNPPPIPGLGATGGLSFVLEQLRGGSPEELADVELRLVAAATKRPELTGLFPQFDPRTPAYELDLDRDKAKQLGVPISDVSDALQAYLGGSQLNDFNAFGTNYKVMMQAAPEFRTDIAKLSLYSVRSAAGNIVPLNTLVQSRSINQPTTITRYNLFRSAMIVANAAPGYSSGSAITAMEQVAAEVLPEGYSYDWTGLSLQEKQTSGQIGVVFSLAIVVVFLVLAILYESWVTPFAVILAAPLSVFGAMLGLTVLGLTNNLYAQIGLILLVGLTAKNAILIVEFAKVSRDQGASAVDAAIAAARLRLRPIIMTSLAFTLGVAPLMLSSGAGAASRVAMGTTVCVGMAIGTALAIFLVPLLFTLSDRLRPAPVTSGTANSQNPAERSGLLRDRGSATVPSSQGNKT